MEMTRDATASEEKSSRSYWGFVLWPVAVIALYVLSPGCGCSHAPEAKDQSDLPKTHLTEKDAIRIAQETAKREGRNLAEYKLPEAHYEFVKKDKTWTVFFAGKVPTVGNHFQVWVDDGTGKATLMPGE